MLGHLILSVLRVTFTRILAEVKEEWRLHKA